jgi:hypothetical protein
MVILKSHDLEKNNESRLIAIVSIFSGRRNPEWELNDDQKKQFFDFWDNAEPSPLQTQLPSTGNYRGLRLTYGNIRWVLFNGTVTRFEKNEIQTKQDPGRKMENFILHTSPPNVKKLLVERKIIGL